MKQNSKTNFLLVINGESRRDTEVQLKFLLDKWNYNQKLKYGLSKINNTAIWIYDGPGKEPHYVQENYRIYFYIQYLLKSMDEPDFLQQHKQNILYINDWWRGQAKSSIEKKRLEKEIQLMTEQRERLYKKSLGLISKASTVYNDEMLARIAIVNRYSGSGETCNDLDWHFVSDKEARIQTPIWELTSGQGYVLESDKGEITFEFSCVGDGNLELKLRGPFKKDEKGNEIPLCLDYKFLKLNDELIFNNTHCIWHKSPYIFNKMGVKDGEIFRFTVRWEKHSELS